LHPSSNKQRPLSSRLSYIQARNCVLVAFIVGMLLSGIQIGLDYLREQDAVEQFANEILAASKFAAADATFHLDAPAAQEIAKGILEYHPVNSVTIINEEELVLANLSRAEGNKEKPSDGFKVFGQLKQFALPLHLNSGERIGSLAITVDPALAVESFIDRSILVILSGVVRNILLSFILIFVFYYTTTKKIISISNALAQLDINHPDKNRIPEHKGHKHDELTWLVSSINHMLGIIDSDIKESKIKENTLKAREKELAYQAIHDTLTGLVNRRGFERRLQQALDSNRLERKEHALCYLDLDQFKVINDTCGHIAGDELLRQVATLLESGIRKHDLLARLGGDEFGILMECCDLDHASRVAESLCEKVDEFRFVWEGQPFSIGVSIGVVSITETAGNTTDLLKKADIACYAAKDAGRHCIHVYHEEDTDLARLQGEMKWATKITQALEQNRFKLYAQTIEPVATGVNHGIHYEVLIRMIDEEGSVIPPAVFLPAAEHYNLITKIDYWVIETTFRYLAEHPQHLEQLAVCSINLSGPSLTAPGFQKFILEQLDLFRIPPEKICLEITETAAITNLALATKFIASLTAKGCRFALDDFGSGLSSFAYLKNLPVDFLKIDGVFVRDIVDDPIDYAMVKSIHEIGHVMGKKTIAEFVENDAIREKLLEIGVDYAQGYGLSLPCPIENLDSHPEPAVIEDPSTHIINITNDTQPGNDINPLPALFSRHL
jgi:diguanylate cyclase (GGDEF)-like protein